MNRLRRLVQPYVVSFALSPAVRGFRRRLAELRRAGGPHRVHYFHQPDDPYSHLAAQVLPELLERYDVEIHPHIVGPPDDAAAPEKGHLEAYSRRDAGIVAPYYGLEFPVNAAAPSRAAVEQATRLLAATGDNFVHDAAHIGEALWSGTTEALEALDLPAATPAAARQAVAEGSALRQRTGHYLGATFHYGGEWYWGVDRLHYLERRLQELGALRRDRARDPVVQPPTFPMAPVEGDRRLRLEFFPSLRSPYTAIAMRRVFDLVERLPVDLILRPVLPMVMRGLPIPNAKRFYVLRDAKREAETVGEPFGFAIDPVGRPIERAFSLFPWAREPGLAKEFLQSFAQAAFTEGIDTHTDRGLRYVVERVGLSWRQARDHLDGEGWRDELEENRRVMFGSNMWGVPSFRLLDGEEPLLETWGQDRLWLVEAEIRRCLGL